MKNRISTEEIKKIEVCILDYIASICEENGIQYYLAYGTLLGAVRHQGFIPWDDDIDIYMLRNDYMRFISVVSQKQHERYKLLSRYNDPDYYYEFAKVVDSKTLVSINNVKTNTKEGVWVDIFPLDYISNHVKIQKTLINVSVAFRILSVYTKFPSDKHNKVFIPLWLISRFIGPTFFLKVTEKLSTMGKNKNEVGYMASIGMLHFHFPAVLCQDKCLLPFEGNKYIAFKEYDKYLTLQYGDYMQLPPIEKRLSHPVEAYWR